MFLINTKHVPQKKKKKEKKKRYLMSNYKRFMKDEISKARN